MSVLVITVPGELRGKGRPRFNTKTGRTYTDEKTERAEIWVRTCALEQVGQPMLLGPISLYVDVQLPIPGSWSKKKRAAALRNELHPTGRPDADNIIKLLADAFNKIVWRDDSQIVDLHIWKRYGPQPRAELVITQMENAA